MSGERIMHRLERCVFSPDGTVSELLQAVGVTDSVTWTQDPGSGRPHVCGTWLSVSAQRLCAVVKATLENAYPKIRGRMPVTASAKFLAELAWTCRISLAVLSRDNTHFFNLCLMLSPLTLSVSLISCKDSHSNQYSVTWVCVSVCLDCEQISTPSDEGAALRKLMAFATK